MARVSGAFVAVVGEGLAGQGRDEPDEGGEDEPVERDKGKHCFGSGGAMTARWAASAGSECGRWAMADDDDGGRRRWGGRGGASREMGLAM